MAATPALASGQVYMLDIRILANENVSPFAVTLSKYGPALKAERSLLADPGR